MKFRENSKINKSRTMRALFRVNGVSIDYLKMDYKRRLCLIKLMKRRESFQTSYNGKAMIGD